MNTFAKEKNTVLMDVERKNSEKKPDAAKFHS